MAEQLLPLDDGEVPSSSSASDRPCATLFAGGSCRVERPVDLLRRKLATEPQVHGGKRTRVVFDCSGSSETSERRSDR